MGSYVVSKTITISAEPQAVWEALTNPEMTKKYFFHCRVSSTWKEGDAISFKGRMFFVKKIELHGKILEIIPGKILKYSLINSGDNTESIVTDELKYVKGETILSVKDDVGAGPGAEERYFRSRKGWDKVLKGLKNLVETTAQKSAQSTYGHVGERAAAPR